MVAIYLVLQGRIGAGLRAMNEAIQDREREGYVSAADWNRLFLCELLLEIVAAKERPPLGLLVKNLPGLIYVLLVALPRIPIIIERIRQNAQFDPNGHFIAKGEMLLGLFYKVKRKRDLALRHLSEARRICGQFGETPMLAKIDATLAELR